MEEQEKFKINDVEISLTTLKNDNKGVDENLNINNKIKVINFKYITIILFLVLANLFQFLFIFSSLNINKKQTKEIELYLKNSLERKNEIKETISSINNSYNENKIKEIEFHLKNSIEREKKLKEAIYSINKSLIESNKKKLIENNKNNMNIGNIKKYFRNCDNGILYENNSEYFKKREKPKISIIIPGYNMEKYATRSIRSVQNQSMKDIEIIFVDDCSSDDTSKIVKKHMKEDYRIVLIKNEENLGLYRSRIKGILASNGEFIQNLDSDDLLIGNILQIAYQKANDLNIDIVEFALIEGTNNELILRNRKLGNKVYDQPKLGNLMWFGKGYLLQTNYNIYTKLIKRNTMINTFKFIGDEFINERINFFEDNLLDFAVLRSGHFLKFIDEYGYYYWRGGGNTIMDSLKKRIDNVEKANDVVKSILTVSKFYYKRTKDNKYDKFIAYEFVIRHMQWGNSSAKIMTKGFKLMKEVFDLYLNCPYFDLNLKRILRNKFNNFYLIDNIENFNNI